MANICENELVITSDPTGKFGKLLLNIEQDIYDGVEGYPIFEVISHGDFFMFQSKWSPPIEWLMSLQKDIPFSCTGKYHEFGSQIVGEYTISEDGSVEENDSSNDYWYGLYSIWCKEVFVNEVSELKEYPNDEILMELIMSYTNSTDTKYKALVEELVKDNEESKELD